MPQKASETRDPRRGPAAGAEDTVNEIQAMAAELTLASRLPGAPAAPETATSDAGYLPPVTELGRVTTARLLPARYSDSVLTRIAAEEDLPAIYALDNATNERLQAEDGRSLHVPAGELVTHGIYARIINAAFTHPHPLGARFSTPFRGAWYSGFELATAKAEVLFHRSVQFAEIRWTQPESLDYDHYAAEFSGPFYDLRSPVHGVEEQARAACLDPASYAHSQALAVRLGTLGAQGVVYPSARRPGGVCLACFQPRSVHTVRKRDMHRLTWFPDRPAVFRRVPRE